MTVGRSTTFYLLLFFSPEDPGLCAVRTLKEYLKVFQPWKLKVTVF